MESPLELDERFDVVLLGFAEGRDEPPAVGLQRVFGVDGKTAMTLLARMPRTVQKNVPRVRAEYFRRALALIGATVEVRARGGRVIPAEGVAVAAAEQSPASTDAADHAAFAAHAPTQLARPAPPAARAPAPAPAPPPPRPGAAATLAWGKAPPGAPSPARPSPIPPEFALPAATLLAPVPPLAISEPTPQEDALPAATLRASAPPIGRRDEVPFEPPAPLFGPSSKTVVDTSNSLAEPAPNPPWAGLSLPPLADGPLPPFERARPPSRAPGPIDPPGGLDWLKLSASFGTQHESAPKVSAPNASDPAAPPNVPFDRFMPLNPEAFAPPVPLAPPKPVVMPELAAAHGAPPAPAAPDPPRVAPRARAQAPTPLATAEPAASAAPRTRPLAPQRPREPQAAAAGGAHASATLDARSFWSTIGEAIALPFQGHGLYWILGVTVWSLVAGVMAIMASFLPMLIAGIVVAVIAQSSVVAFACDFFKVCMWVPTTGDKMVDRSPQLEPEKMLYTYILSGLHLMAFAIVSMLPLGFWAYKSLSRAAFADPNALVAFAVHPVTWLLVVLPCVYWPIGVGLTALANDFGAIWNVPLALKGMARAPMQCLAIVVIGWLAFGALWVALALFGSSMGLSAALMQAGGGFPLAASHGIMGALFGHLVRAKPDLFD